MKNILNFISTTLLIFLSSCKQEQPLTLHHELAPYFEAFAEEGALRGITVNYDSAQIEGIIKDIETTKVTGQCEHNSLEPERVIIDQVYWNQANDLEKEFVVFHELGHCFLGRNHLDTQNSNGTCKSMMHSGQSNCRNAYSVNTREDYLDELFSN